MFRHKVKRGKHADEVGHHRHFSIIAHHAQLDLEATGDNAAETYRVWSETLTVLVDEAAAAAAAARS